MSQRSVSAEAPLWRISVEMLQNRSECFCWQCRWRIQCERTTRSRTGLCGPLRMWALAPSQADARADRGGVPSRSVIRSSWRRAGGRAESMLKKELHLPVLTTLTAVVY